MILVPLLDLKFFFEACGFTRKNFKSAALVWFRFRNSQEGLAGKSGELLDHHTKELAAPEASRQRSW
jgi:hypothetical protein